MTKAKVIVYSASWCAFCHAAKDYFDKIGVIDIDGDIIVGFDRPKIDASLKKHDLIKS